MSDPRLTLKINIMHDVRPHDTDVEAITERVVRFVNHPDERVEGMEVELDEEVSAGVEDARIAVGHRASAVFLELASKRRERRTIDQLVTTVVREMDNAGYAGNVEQHGDWLISATEPGRYV